jgi:hypothetical protein
MTMLARPLAGVLAGLLTITPLAGRAEPVRDQEIAALKAEIAGLRQIAVANRDRGEIENLFSRYMYLHNAFHDPEIIPLWVKKGTADVHAQYSNNGVYTNWDNIMAYHAQRPNPKGKLTFHYTTTPLIEVAADGQTAKGLWVMSGVESGLTDPVAAQSAPDFMYEKTMVDGKRVWMHTVLVKYGIDFLKQDGQWRIWHFHCFEIARSPHGIGWIPFAAQSENNPFSDDLMYFGENGKAVFMPKPDAPVTMRNNPYRTDTGQTLDAPPPVPYRTFADTFSY